MVWRHFCIRLNLISLVIPPLADAGALGSLAAGAGDLAPNKSPKLNPRPPPLAGSARSGEGVGTRLPASNSGWTSTDGIGSSLRLDLRGRDSSEPPISPPSNPLARGFPRRRPSLGADGLIGLFRSTDGPSVTKFVSAAAMFPCC